MTENYIRRLTGHFNAAAESEDHSTLTAELGNYLSILEEFNRELFQVNKAADIATGFLSGLETCLPALENGRALSRGRWSSRANLCQSVSARRGLICANLCQPAGLICVNLWEPAATKVSFSYKILMSELFFESIIDPCQ